MSGFMEEVMDLLNSIMETNMIVQTGNFTQETKEAIRGITDVALNETLELTDPMKVAKLQLLAKMELEK